MMTVRGEVMIFSGVLLGCHERAAVSGGLNKWLTVKRLDICSVEAEVLQVVLVVRFSKVAILMLCFLLFESVHVLVCDVQILRNASKAG